MATQQGNRAHNFIDLTGRVFGNLTVMRLAGRNQHGRLLWECRCDCGNTAVYKSYKLTSGIRISCGCRCAVIRTHGLCRTPEYKIWKGMIKRCENQRCKEYKDYGGRGIKVHPLWRADFKAFYAYVGPRPSDKHSIDRYPDNNGNYEPGNVRWATKNQQLNNRRVTKLLTLNGETASVSDWSQKLGISSDTIKWRIKHGWTTEQALTPIERRGD